jgi:hypothetical protein
MFFPSKYMKNLSVEGSGSGFERTTMIVTRTKDPRKDKSEVQAPVRRLGKVRLGLKFVTMHDSTDATC